MMDDKTTVQFVNDPEQIPKGHRPLGPGEKVDGSRLLGFPCVLEGTGVRMAIWDGGAETVSIPAGAVSTFRRMEALRLILGGVSEFNGRQIRLIRRELGLTQAQLAEELGVTRTTLNQLENEVGNPGKSKTRAIKHIGLPLVRRLVNEIDPHDRGMNRGFFEALQNVLTQLDTLPDEAVFRAKEVELCHA